MEKYVSKEWVSSVESAIDRKLSKWLKGRRIENGEAIHFDWQFEQTHMFLDIFWEDGKESAHFTYVGPRSTQRFEWHKLDKATINKIMDKVGNLAQVTMHPYHDYHE